jgi:hypothetical protein
MNRLAYVILGATLFLLAFAGPARSSQSQGPQPVQPTAQKPGVMTDGAGETPPAAAPPTLPATFPPTPSPYVWWAGPISAVTERSAHRIMTANEWKSLWTQHLGSKLERGPDGQPLIPEIDFSRCMVMAIFGGPDRNVLGYKIRETLEAAQMIRLRYETVRMASDGAEPQPTSAFGIFVIPRSLKRVEIQEAVPKGGEPGKYDYLSRAEFSSLLP